ncbi:(d)CMP kinase [Parvicella tangerina]|uniref:Cytidylate kinase n=1 Tax=Parvicella tangerina TaxID=2829795 RepID=A0A916JPC4_9FLAO|nr:(d)CMP kinase [Parvicella tangerina]CAG5083997.1 Cytidylate kinase [Parvicella tangerina]
MQKIIIAIDGHSACGKSTLAKALAKELKYVYIDSGAMYRAVTLYAIENDWILDEGKEVDREPLIENLDNINISFNYNSTSGKSDTYLNGINIETEIREMPVARAVSAVSKIKEVREKLVEFQQKLGKNKGIVMDGRDIGTVVFPDAELKLWITANMEVRTARRYKELIEMGSHISVDEVKQNIEARDYEDSHRAESPLKRADDAIDIDNSYLSKEETLHEAVRLVNEKLLSIS